MMRRPSLLMLGFLCLCLLMAAPLGASESATPTTVYVSGGPYIYNVWSDGSLHKVYDATLITPLGHNDDPYPGPHYSSLVTGPDNVDLGANSNAEYPSVIYACDDHTNTILRFVPTGTLNPPAEILSTGTAAPTCGRFTSTGDFYFTSGNSVYEVKGAAAIAFNTGHDWWAGATITGPLSLGIGSGAALAGITQKNVGDLLVVDTANNQVLRSAWGSSFGASSSYITGLNRPAGIARISTGDVFIGNAGASAIAHFSTVGSPIAAGVCSTLNFPSSPGIDTNIRFLAASERDTVYVAASTTENDASEDLDFAPESDNPGALWMWTPQNPNNCHLSLAARSQTELSGVAVGPIATALITESVNSPLPPANPSPTDFNFNSSDFQITANGCSATVTAYPLSLANIQSMIGLATNLPTGATPIVNLGEGGYEIAYVAHWNGCSSVLSDHTFGNAIFGFYDPSTASNPRILRCDSSPADDANEPFLDGSNACVALGTLGSYPLGGPLKGDPGTIGHGLSNSVFVLVNAKPSAGSSGTTGNFCGFYLPIKNTTDPNNATLLDTDDFLPIAFQLAQDGGNCKTGPFIGNAQALLSVAQIADGSGNPTFNPILNIKTVLNLGATFPPPGLCKYFPHSILSCTYALILNVQGSGLVPGTYELSVQFLTGNAPPQAVVFKVVPEGTPGTL